MGADNSKDGYNRAPVDEWEGWGDDEDDSTITQQPQSEGGLSSLFKFSGNKDGETEKNKAKKKRGGNDESGGVMATMKNQMTKAGQKLGVVEKKPSLADEMCKMCPKLTMQQRIAGFCAFTGLGYMLAILGTLTLSQGYTEKNIQKFAQLYIAGNLIALAASACFKGPKKLFKAMIHKKRRVGTAVWFSLMILIFILAYTKAPLPILLTLLVFETMAGIWYAASYIPWGRKMIISCCQASFFSPCPETLTPIAKQV